jgi:peptidoglycan/LPS O-acetylase OafA/YrhL
MSGIGPVVYIVLNVLVPVIVSFAVFFLVEKPLRQMASNFHKQRRRVVAAAAGV